MTSRAPAWIFVACGALSLALGLGLGARQRAFLASARTAEATVVRLEQRSSTGGGAGRSRYTYAPVFVFEVDGKSYEVTSKTSSDPPQWDVGDRFEVLYDPADPGRAQPRSFLSQWFLTGMFSLLGVVFLVIGLVLLRR